MGFISALTCKRMKKYYGDSSLGAVLKHSKEDAKKCGDGRNDIRNKASAGNNTQLFGVKYIRRYILL